MKTFKQYLLENIKDGYTKLDSAKAANKGTSDEDYWLSTYHTKDYTDNREEVRPSDLGMKMLNSDHISQQHVHKDLSKHSYELTKLKHIPLDQIHYTQPRVNREKLRYFMNHYHPTEDDFHQNGGELRKYEAPHVTKYPDGTYTSPDHHRLIASHLRGDTHAIARVLTLELGKDGKFKQVKTK